MTSHELARYVRENSLKMVHRSGASHIGSCLSCADLLACLYTDFLNVSPSNFDKKERDYFIMSKGHAAAALYSVLAGMGFFEESLLETYCCDGSKLGGHVTASGIPGVEFSTGSLGHGLSVGVGLGLAFKRHKMSNRVVIMLSDGECNEGSIWEAVLNAATLQLDNLLVIVDYNKIQSFGRIEEINPLEPFEDKWIAFGWAVKRLNGHCRDSISSALKGFPFQLAKPSVIIADTIKGKGVSYMEDKLKWHYSSPNDEQLVQALREL